MRSLVHCTPLRDAGRGHRPGRVHLLRAGTLVSLALVACLTALGPTARGTLSFADLAGAAGQQGDRTLPQTGTSDDAAPGQRPAWMASSPCALASMCSETAPPMQHSTPAAPAADPVMVALAFDAAWSAHDVDAVVALFAPDGVVHVPGALWNTGIDGAAAVGDVFGARLTAVYGQPPSVVEGEAVRWRGSARIREWALLLFALRHRTEATGHASTDGQVTWRYRARVDPYQTIPGVPAAEGTAVASVRDSRIMDLSLVPAAGSAQARGEAVQAAVASARATLAASPYASAPARRVGGSAPPAPPPDAGRLPLIAAGLAAAAWALMVARGRVRRSGAET